MSRRPAERILDQLVSVHAEFLQYLGVTGESRVRKLMLIKDLITTVSMAARKEEDNLLPEPPELQYMTEPELSVHINRMMRFIYENQTVDTVGSMLVVFGKDKIAQYGATIEPEDVPAQLRELADRIENQETIRRG